jgi:hypothetical protein
MFSNKDPCLHPALPWLPILHQFGERDERLRMQCPQGSASWNGGEAWPWLIQRASIHMVHDAVSSLLDLHSVGRRSLKSLSRSDSNLTSRFIRSVQDRRTHDWALPESKVRMVCTSFEAVSHARKAQSFRCQVKQMEVLQEMSL